MQHGPFCTYSCLYISSSLIHCIHIPSVDHMQYLPLILFSYTMQFLILFFVCVSGIMAATIPKAAIFDASDTIESSPRKPYPFTSPEPEGPLLLSTKRRKPPRPPRYGEGVNRAPFIQPGMSKPPVDPMERPGPAGVCGWEDDNALCCTTEGVLTNVHKFPCIKCACTTSSLNFNHKFSRPDHCSGYIC